MDLVHRARVFDFQDMSLAGLVRLSHEQRVTEHLFTTGHDISGREVQAEDCAKFVTVRGGIYVHTYEEPDTSAYKHRRIRLPDGRTVYRVVRPVFDQALEDLKRGCTVSGERLDGLIVYDIDRLTRDPRHLEDCIEVVVHYGRPIIDVTGSLDLLTDNGRTMARVIVATANKQSADTARRVKRKAAAMQQAGIPGGGFRPFGWQDDRRTLLEREAAAIREAVERILKGTPVPAIAIEWNERGLATSRGHRWLKQTLLQVLRNPRLCGLRARTVREVRPETQRESAYHEIVLKTGTSEPVIGLWEPIISVEDWEHLMAVIGDRTIAARGHNTRKFLLSGILRCGHPICGAKLVGGSFTRSGGRHHKYMCPSKAQGGCGGLSINGVTADDYVIQQVITRYPNLHVAPESKKTLVEKVSILQSVLNTVLVLPCGHGVRQGTQRFRIKWQVAP